MLHPSSKLQVCSSTREDGYYSTSKECARAFNRPPRELIQNPSPAKSTITGIGGQDDTVGCRATSATVEEVARCRRGGKRKEHPAETGDDSITTNQRGGGVQFAPLIFEEGHADGSVTGGDDDDEADDLGDSDVEGGEADIHNKGLNLRTVLKGSNKVIGDDANNLDPFCGEEFDAVTGEEEGCRQISGAPESWVPPGPPTAWKGYEPKIDLDAPVVAAVDNPGSWNLFSFEAKYGTEKGKRKYLGHFTPALAKVVPPDENGNREVQGWKFHYNGWKPDEFDRQTYARGDASAMNLKPESRRGSLDVNVLKKHGCDGSRVRDNPLFLPTPISVL